MVYFVFLTVRYSILLLVSLW